MRSSSGAANRMRSLLWVLAAAILSPMGHADAANKSKLSIYQHSKPVADMPCGTQPLKSRSAVLMGGGVDVPAAFAFMIREMTVCADESTGKPGNFVVVRAGGNPAYDSYIYKQGPVSAVVTIVVPDRASALAIGDPDNEVGQQVQTLLKSAGAIWLTGGDQGDYYNFWKETPLEKLISSQVQYFGIPIGGTSAGMMILSQFNYIPDMTYTSTDALYRPAYMQQWLKDDFWSSPAKTPFYLLSNTVTDSHFDRRDRMGRLTTFLADVIVNRWASVSTAKAMGVDQETALLLRYVPARSGNSITVDPAQVVANEGAGGAAYVLSATNKSVINTDGPLTFTNVNVDKYYVDAKSGKTSTHNYQFSVKSGLIYPPVNGSLY